MIQAAFFVPFDGYDMQNCKSATPVKSVIFVDNTML